MRIKTSIRNEVKKDSKSKGDDVGMSPQAKVKIIAYHLAGYPVKSISGIMGFSMDWLRVVIEVLSCDREFVHMAKELKIAKYNGADTIDTDDETKEQPKPKPKEQPKPKPLPKEESNILDDLGLNDDIETTMPSLKRRGRPPGSKNKKK
jgi:hypothetical protein